MARKLIAIAHLSVSYTQSHLGLELTVVAYLVSFVLMMLVFPEKWKKPPDEVFIE